MLAFLTEWFKNAKSIPARDAVELLSLLVDDNFLSLVNPINKYSK